MTYQSKFAGYFAFKEQAGIGTQATGAGGIVYRQTGGTPAKLAKAAIQSKEIRQDAQPVRGRHGQQTSTGGPYSGELSLGTFDAIFQALLRGTWDTEITKTQADFTSLTTGANSIVFGSGNPITMGFRVNDVIECVGLSDAANNGRNLRIAALSSTAITVAETLTVNATPDTSCSITRRGRKVINPPAGSLVNRYFTGEDYDADIDASKVFTDCYWKSGKFSMQPNGIIMFDASWVGTGKLDVNTASTAPILTAPTLTASIPLAALDSTLRLGGVDVADIVSWDMTIDNGAVAPAVIGSKISPTVLPGLNQVSMNLQVLKKDMSYLQAFLGETGFSLSLLAAANTSEPKDFISINIPNFTLGSADDSARATDGGAATVTIPVPAALIGHDSTGAGYDDTTVSIQVSNNS
ncbi:phage tail tube protein [Bradyrhizobium sp. SZCCHNR2032]|uniref:phage tail tube protein n=1 Tax=Bradyrhizobium sp. SZCCHNR2032 TaxID=3057384 RepID=UPI0029171159|nr:phage tail tube protein [Bradyrhizobium sp. SZCCHNR2032]